MDSLWLNISRLSAPRSTCKSSFCAHARGVRLYYSDPCNAQAVASHLLLSGGVKLRTSRSAEATRVCFNAQPGDFYCVLDSSATALVLSALPLSPNRKSSSFNPPVCESETSSKMCPFAAASGVLVPLRFEKDDGDVVLVFLECF